MTRRFCAAVLIGAAALGFTTAAPAADLTEEQIRAIIEEVATRVAKEVAQDIAEDVAAEVAEEVVTEFLENADVAFTEEFLADAANIEAGKVIWDEQCALCHGAKAYPGKAPKLKPKRYTPEFVYDRVTNGFNKMPAWKDVYTKDERMDLVAWIKSRKFSP